MLWPKDDGQYQLECENVKVIYSLLRQAHVIYTKHMFVLWLKDDVLVRRKAVGQILYYSPTAYTNV